jgi:hypothetical protein
VPADAILDKAAMYRLLAAGRLGNTIPQFFDRGVWSRFVGDHPDRYPYWGVRSMAGGGDNKSRLNVPTPGVFTLLDEWFPGAAAGFNVSPMIDRFAQLRVEMNGDTLDYVDPAAESQLDPRHPWRDGFARFRRRVGSPAAIRAILKAYLWPADLENVERLLDEYPGHTIEFSACDRACGVEPDCNTIVWEVRRY